MFYNRSGEEKFFPAVSSVVVGVFIIFGVLLQRFLLAFPLGKLPLTFLALVICQDVRPDTACDFFNLVLRDIAVIDYFLASTQENLLR